MLQVFDVASNSVVYQKSYDLPLSQLKWNEKSGLLTFIASVYPGMNMSQTLQYDTLRSDNYHSTAIAFDTTPIFSYNALRAVFPFFFFFLTLSFV